MSFDLFHLSSFSMINWKSSFPIPSLVCFPQNQTVSIYSKPNQSELNSEQLGKSVKNKLAFITIDVTKDAILTEKVG